MKQRYQTKKRKPIREVRGANFYGETSPYWNFMGHVAEAVGFEPTEDPLANPDVLTDDRSLYHRPLTEVGELQMQAVRETLTQLSKQEYRVFKLVAKDGRTWQEAADDLSVKKSTVQTILNRVRVKMQRKYEALLTQENMT